MKKKKYGLENTHANFFHYQKSIRNLQNYLQQKAFYGHISDNFTIPTHIIRQMLELTNDIWVGKNYVSMILCHIVTTNKSVQNVGQMLLPLQKLDRWFPR